MTGVFANEGLERQFQYWRARTSSRVARILLICIAVTASCCAIAHAPAIRAAKAAPVALGAMAAHAFAIVRPHKQTTVQVLCVLLLILDCALALPSHDALFPALIAVFASYVLLSIPFLFCLLLCTGISVFQLSFFILFQDPLKTTELLAIIIVHIWSHFIGVYLLLTKDRLSRNAFLSGRNAVESENTAEQQSQRLNRLLSAFLPPHLITTTRHQIAQYTPQIYAEQYGQVTIAYSRIQGLEAVLSQCSPIDAARLLKEFDARIDRLAASHCCLRVSSDGITVVSAIPGIDSDHAAKVVGFAADLEALVTSFRDATCADVTVCTGIDSGSVTCGVVGHAKWHYDVIGIPVDNAVLLQNSAPSDGLFITDDTRRQLGSEWKMENTGEYWRVQVEGGAPAEMFPVNKRFSLVTVPQAVNRLLMNVAATDRTMGMRTMTLAGGKKRKEKVKGQDSVDSSTPYSSGTGSLMGKVTLKFTNEHVEEEYHKEMDQLFIPALAISIFFLVVYGIYHILVMPRLVTSLALIVVALTLMFFILLMLYVNFFQSFSNFIARTSCGHSLTVLLILAILFTCGIVNTFSCPVEPSAGVCEKVHFSAFSFAMWILTTSIFLRFSSFLLSFVLTAAVATYAIQVVFNHPPIGAKQFGTEFDLLAYLILLCLLVAIHARECEKLLRLDFLAAVKGIEEAASKDRLSMLNSQILLNLVPSHLLPALTSKTAGDVWQHAHHSVGVAYLAISGFDLHGEQGLNALNYIFSHFDQTLTEYKGIEKVKSANRFYIVAVGLVPDAAQNVNETPWTIGDLLFTLANYLIQISQFATEKQFEVQIGIDCGSTLSVVTDTDRPKYELWGDTVERARLLMQSACHDKLMVSEEIYLALRPRQFNFSSAPTKVTPTLNAYVLRARDDDDTISIGVDNRSMSYGYDNPANQSMSVTYDIENSVSMSTTAQEKHTMKLFQQAAGQKHPIELLSSMNSSFSSDLHSIDGGGETDSDIEWITPETALINHQLPPLFAPPGFKPDQNCLYSDYSEQENSRNPSRMSSASSQVDQVSHRSSRSRNSAGRRRWKRSYSKNPLRWMRRENSMSTDNESLAALDPRDRFEAAANRVDRMLQELNAYGEFADNDSQSRVPDCNPFPTSFGSMKSVDEKRRKLQRAVSSAAHTEYDNAESEQALSDPDSRAPSRSSRRTPAKNKRRKWFQRTKRDTDGVDADAESQCSSMASSMDLDPLRWKSVHSIGYDNEYEIQSDHEGLAVEEMMALSRDIRKNFGDYELAKFDDIDQDEV